MSPLIPMPPADVLDRPVWHALTGRQAALAEGDEHGLRFAPEYGPFAASRHPAEGLATLVSLPDCNALWLMEKRQPTPPPGWTIAKSAECVQMIARSVIPGGRDCAFCDLGDDDAAAMLALATLTQPGPFARHTHRLGHFIGIKHDGNLVAMAGERMKPGGYTELSGVCCHPDYRGRGYAGYLMRVIASRMLDRGEIPFLHCYATNKGAIALYESLGFAIHQSITAIILMPV
ncbi:GNAT family N-acetyltransferase [Sphingobium sp.]|uniref:GNAT family N-acetyltransferase n=1 Tax=Sphingobium sp. TaxID=1912891 RepID=UPI003BB50582